jgi:hypothetical protein
MIDWTKPIQTADGRPARVLATDIRSNTDHTIAVAVLEGDHECVVLRRPDGTTTWPTTGWNIINAPERVSRYQVLFPANRSFGSTCMTMRAVGEQRRIFYPGVPVVIIEHIFEGDTLIDTVIHRDV